MTNRERFNAIMHYRPYDRLPLVHFGFWPETLEKWRDEGHLKTGEFEQAYDGSEAERSMAAKLGFDFNFFTCHRPVTALFPAFEGRVVETLPDGSRKVLNEEGVIVLQKDGTGSIPAEVGHTLTDRASWEEHYVPRLRYSEKRLNARELTPAASPDRDTPLGLICGSLFGVIRNWLGVEGLSYLQIDDEGLYDEIIGTVACVCLRTTESILTLCDSFDFAHFWEDICFKNGPLVHPEVFRAKVGPHYRAFAELLTARGIDIISLDCDGCIDQLLPAWLDNGVNTVFPIEVGTWNASIAPWRARYGKTLRGVGGMDKRVFARDYAAVDAEVERLKPLVELGGYIPCPDHRIPPDAIWENVQYYCERMRHAFG